MQKKVNIIFNQIEKLRAKNNRNWMDLLRLSFKSNPEETIKIVNSILSKDEKLISLAQSLKKFVKKK
tara:strand:- start:317 stop:517 length:201 start_codon:yes stop_codon:yes gene_type:complete